MGDVMAEPLSKLKPPGVIDIGEERVRPAKVQGAGDSGLEWTIVDYDSASMPGGEVFLPGLWKRMHDDGTFKMFFHEGPEMNFVQFGAVLTNPAEKVQLIIGSDAEGTAKEHAGMLVLNHILHIEGVVKRAVGNFLFFREYWDHRETMALGSAVMDHWFGPMGFDVIAGITPRGNRAAIAFIKRLGFQVVGDVPGFTVYDGKPCASATSYMTKEMWATRKAKGA